MKLHRNLAVVVSLAALAACGGGSDTAANNVADETVLESENLDAALNADTSLNGTDQNALDLSATDANASANELISADSANLTNAAQ